MATLSSTIKTKQDFSTEEKLRLLSNDLQSTSDRTLFFEELPSGSLIVGNNQGGASKITPTGDVTFSDAGVTAIKSSVTLSGSPTTTTQSTSTNNTTIATTAFVRNAINYNVLFVQTASVTVANTITETTLLGSGVGSASIPANLASIGKTIKVSIIGYKSKSGGAASIDFKFKIGGTTVCTTGAITQANSTNFLFKAEIFITFRTIGVDGTAFIQGYVLNSTGSVGLQMYPMGNTSVTTINTTESKAIDFTATWSSAAADNTVTVSNVFIEYIL